MVYIVLMQISSSFDAIARRDSCTFILVKRHDSCHMSIQFSTCHHETRRSFYCVLRSVDMLFSRHSLDIEQPAA